MKALFKHIGPVKDAELTLSDLTIIAGSNNTGKTYLAYTLYGSLKMLREFSVMRKRVKHLPFDLDEAANRMIHSGKAEFHIEKFEKEARQSLESFYSLSNEAISDIFGAPADNFKGSEFLLAIDDVPKFSGRRESSVDIDMGDGETFQLSASFEGETLSFRLLDSEWPLPSQIKWPARINAIKDMLLSVYIKLFAQKLPAPFILSAERLGISLFYKELDFTKNRLMETFQKLKERGSKDTDSFFMLMENASSSYAQPVKDNINYTRSLEFVQKKNSATGDEKLFGTIKDMMEGYFKYEEGGIRFVSSAAKKGKFNIPLHLASSSARGLSDLYFFLKHVAQKDHLLIIDEPESHLSASNQIEMARLLARCVNCGLKVLITTHSDYIIKEFNNLIMLSRNFSGKEAFLKKHSKCYGNDDYLKPEAVAAYICEKGSLTACEVDGLGLNMPHFDDAIDQINAISNTLALFVEP